MASLAAATAATAATAAAAATTWLMVLLAGAQLTASSAPATRCCMPQQFQLKQVYTYVTSEKGNYNFGQVWSDNVYDAVNKKLVYISTRSDNLGPRSAYAYYMLYQEKVMYMYNNQTGMCIKYPLSSPFPYRCMPAAAPVTEAQVVYGAGGQRLTTLRTVVHVPRSDNATLELTLTLTPRCIPVLEKLVIPYPGGGLKTESSEFTDLKVGAIPSCLTDIPSACSTAITERPPIFPSISFDI